MAFKKIGSLDPHGGPILRTELLGNSVQAVIGRALECDEGSLQLATAAELLAGHLEGIVNNAGMTPTVNGNSGDFTMFYLTTATNGTVAKMKGVVDISKFSLYSVDPDATINTTAGSGKLGWHTDLITGGDFTDEDAVIAGTAQYFIHGVDPADSGNAIVNIYESEIFGV